MADHKQEQAETAEQNQQESPQEELESAVAGDAVEDEPTLESVVAQLEEDLAAARDAALRSHADAQNIKRRAEQDVEKARKFGLEQFSRELLPVVDNLERALEAAVGQEEAVKPFTEGVELTLKSFLDALRKFNIEAVDPMGEPFDPNLHQAMSMVANPDVEPNSVIAVMQKGYTLNGRLLRPAMVMVSKAAD
ncbi:MAG: nucleotide exchange factor GrpE [Halieaceae bacterium]|nr:nucleotide exchange factor GrpE [Halieaceae bacterium]